MHGPLFEIGEFDDAFGSAAGEEGGEHEFVGLSSLLKVTDNDLHFFRRFGGGVEVIEELVEEVFVLEEVHFANFANFEVVFCKFRKSLEN